MRANRGWDEQIHATIIDTDNINTIIDHENKSRIDPG
jgi:hypothetical protein